MYPLEHVYSLKTYKAWRRREATSRYIELRKSRQSALKVGAGPFWKVKSWDELRGAISFLTLMNKRNVLYFRGQGAHYDQCVPTLFRDEWFYNGSKLPLNPDNRGQYYTLLRELRADVLKVCRQVGTPRTYILDHLPAAAASILQHYELWPTHFVDLTRSLPTALAFAEGNGDRKRAYLYVFAMPDLRGSITSDIDQHLTLSRLEAICPPDAIRPHHQDAYLVTRFPEPMGSAGPGDPSWDDWQAKTDLMRRVVAKFLLKLRDGRLPGAPRLESSFLIPSLKRDVFGKKLHKALHPIIEKHLEQLA